MKLKLAIPVALLCIFISTDVFAGYRSCKWERFIDVRGDSTIDGVLGDDPDGYVTIGEVAAANPLGNLGTLVEAVLAADPSILDALTDPHAKLTVFAPEDEAFEAIPPDFLDAILADQELLTSVLLYHVVDRRLDPRRIRYIRRVKSLLGQNLFIKRGRRNPSVNQSKIQCTGVKTDNGLVWLIDSVLLPQFTN